jgi:hypothetical protein
MSARLLPLHPREPTLSDKIAEHLRERDELAAEEARSLETMLYDLVELAERIASADAVHKVGVRQIARSVVVANRGLALNLQSLSARKS